jgi:hypothetical protein
MMLTASEMPTRRTIPFDYAFRYELTGQPGKVLRQVVTVSIEAVFVAVSIGYGAIPKTSPFRFGPKPSLPGGATGPVVVTALPPATLRTISMGALMDGLADAVGDPEALRERIGPGTAEVLKNGLKLNPEFAELVLQGGGRTGLEGRALGELFQAVAAPPDQIVFKYALFDDGSGREFQSDPLLNIAGLGISTGARPFRYLAKPITFAPRSAIRMEITEISEFRGDLHVSLQGYKVLGGAGTPTGRARRRARRVVGR